MEISSNVLETNSTGHRWRVGLQPVLPARINKDEPAEGYDIYPFHSLDEGEIFSGYQSLATWIAEERFVAIDGYAGVFWNDIREALTARFEKMNLKVNWFDTSDYLKDSEEIRSLIAPFLGTEGSVWGKKTSLVLGDFFLLAKLPIQAPDADINIIIGTGAALLNREAKLIYFDLPKNELQLRMRAKSITNLGNNSTATATEMYKRFYFIDWVVLNEHKKNISERISLIADAQRKDQITWTFSEHLREALNKLSRSVFRVRPWFEPGAWGGQWMKQHIQGLNKDEINYAWSFELIVPENGIIFERNGRLLEVSFDFLMFQEHRAVLGRYSDIFGHEFPIRFDFLDTWDGGNLSIQCHPSLGYIRERFGETITQDETYYILDCQPGASVYLGFREDIDPQAFRQELEESHHTGKKVDVEKFVQLHPARKHDLFLIPNGTVHSAATGNLVLEISATPYIFTFKMYDWLRLDLNGEPRAINIEHAFNNLNFDRKGQKVAEELISQPMVIESGPDWELVHLPTHREHFYDIHRIEFDSRIVVDTAGSCHVLMLVEGTSVMVETADGSRRGFHFGETFVIPAAAVRYILTNNAPKRARVVKAFIKDVHQLTHMVL